MESQPEILLVEDNIDDRDLFISAVHASGIQARVTHVGDVTQAVLRLNRMGTYANTPLPTLVVIDLGLPGLQGTALLQVIRNAYGPRTIPVVILTGSYRTADRKLCEDYAISDYLIKPNTYVEQIRLVSSLRRWLSRSITEKVSQNDIPTGPHAVIPEKKNQNNYL